MTSSKKDLTAKIAALNVENMPVILSWMVAAAVSMLISVVIAYFWIFGSNSSTGTQQTWGEFGDFIGGTLNPLFSFLSLIALVLTVVLQGKQLNLAHAQLQNSKDELHATQLELKNSAESHRLSAAALQEQAKYSVIAGQVAALRASLEIASESLAQSAGQLAGPGTYQRLLQRKEFIASEILRITDELVSAKNNI
jgi:hypothetical protein